MGLSTTSGMPCRLLESFYSYTWIACDALVALEASPRRSLTPVDNYAASPSSWSCEDFYIFGAPAKANVASQLSATRCGGRTPLSRRHVTRPRTDRCREIQVDFFCRQKTHSPGSWREMRAGNRMSFCRHANLKAESRMPLREDSLDVSRSEAQTEMQCG